MAENCNGNAAAAYHILDKSNYPEIVRKAPKKFALVGTEIKCSEKAKGGVKYDVILAKATNDTPPKPKSILSPTKAVSEVEIAEKLKAAEERRQALQENKRNSLNAHLSHVDEIVKKQEWALEEQKMKLEEKLTVHKENREAHLEQIKMKSKEKVDRAKEVCHKVKAQTPEATNGCKLPNA